MMKLKLIIDGMSCGHCVGAVEGALSGLPGQQGLTVSVGAAELELPDGTDVGGLSAMVEDLGFTVRDLSTDTD